MVGARYSFRTGLTSSKEGKEHSKMIRMCWTNDHCVNSKYSSILSQVQCSNRIIAIDTPRPDVGAVNGSNDDRIVCWHGGQPSFPFKTVIQVCYSV